MTLIEMMISIAVGSIIFSAVALLSFYNSRSLAALANYADLDQESRFALDIMSREIRTANAITSYATNEIIFSTGSGSNNLRYVFTASAEEFSQFKDGVRTELLTGCKAMAITLYGRNMISNQFSQFAVTNLANAKMVQFNWTCERSVLGTFINSENVQSAKIVVRKQN
jgi:prepilin-type N-terminal cleavage/methylation domain-containing protein